MKKFRIKNGIKVPFTGEVEFRDLESLLQQALLEFDQETVIPGKDGDFTIGTGNFTNKAHKRASVPKCNPKPVGKEVLLVFLLIVKLAFECLKLVLQVPVDRTCLEVVVLHLSDNLLELQLALAQEVLHCQRIRFH